MDKELRVIIAGGGTGGHIFPAIAIAKITGHKTQESFMKYIRMTEEENARTLATHPFFTGSPPATGPHSGPDSDSYAL